MTPPSLVFPQLFGPNASYDGYAWQPFRDGVEIFRLYGDGISGPAAALLRYRVGGAVPHHTHTGVEHVLILRGSQADERGRYHPGDCVINSAGSAHTVTSSEGCIVLVIWNSPIEFS